MFADLRDETFELTVGACYVIGFAGNPWIDQFAGVGPSGTPYHFKAVMTSDGKIYIPDPEYAAWTPKRERNYARYPMVPAYVQPPAHRIVTLW
jgi:hypothetical protein